MGSSYIPLSTHLHALVSKHDNMDAHTHTHTPVAALASLRGRPPNTGSAGQLEPTPEALCSTHSDDKIDPST